ncbi:MAG TPA: YeiH family protein [Burkholderiaceae bacterium]|nr:YeiH family protein [Burkholderiaceae bacterium]
MSHAATAAPRSAAGDPGNQSWWAGIALAGAVAAAAIAAAHLTWAHRLGLSALTLAIIFGIIAGNTFFPAIAPGTAAGVDFSRNTLLRAGVILYGFRITFGQLAEVGWAGAAIDVLMVALTYTIAVQLGTRVFKLDRETSLLIGTGSAICGAAAVLAAEPVVHAQPHKVSVAVATVVVFGTLGMFLYPLVYPLLGLSPHAYGIFAGSTIHEVAQVIAAGRAVSDAAAAPAVIEKMMRVMMLAPFLFLLSRAHQHRDNGHAASGAGGVVDRGRVTVPWFAVLFIVACAVNSVGVLPAGVVKYLVDADTLLLAMAMAALGLRTHAGAIRQAGARPLMLAGALFAFLTVGGYGVNRLVTSLLG